VEAGRELVGRHPCRDLNSPFHRALGFSSLSSLASHTRRAKALMPIVSSPTGFPALIKKINIACWKSLGPACEHTVKAQS